MRRGQSPLGVDFDFDEVSCGIGQLWTGQITAGELLDWIDERIAILKARNPHMRIYAVRDIDDAELRKLEAFKDELTELSLCACNDLTPWSSVETLSRDGYPHQMMLAI